MWELEGNAFKAQAVEMGNTNGMLTDIVSCNSERADVLVVSQPCPTET